MNKRKRRVKFRNIYIGKKVNYAWVIIITIVTFFIAMVLGYISLISMERVSLTVAVILLLLIVFLGIFFDLLGIAVTAGTEQAFHSMAASKVKGAKESIRIIRNAGAVANFFNDVIGDVAGIISGSATVAILVKLNRIITIKSMVISILLTAVIAAITVGGKAIGKEIALRHANFIVYRLGLVLSYIRRR